MGVCGQEAVALVARVAAARGEINAFYVVLARTHGESESRELVPA